MKPRLFLTLPKISAYFGQDEFMGIERELDRYHKNVRKYYTQFVKTQNAWANVMRYLAESNLCEDMGEAIG